MLIDLAKIVKIHKFGLATFANGYMANPNGNPGVAKSNIYYRAYYINYIVYRYQSTSPLRPRHGNKTF